MIEQVRLLVSEPELRGLVADLRPTIPDLAKLSAETKPLLTPVPAGLELLQRGRHPVVERHAWIRPPATRRSSSRSGNVAEETASGLVGIASESRSGDANGQYIRVEAGGGAEHRPDPGRRRGSGHRGPVDAVGPPRLPAAGRHAQRPRQHRDSSGPSSTPRVACETQDPPDLSAAGVTSATPGSTRRRTPWASTTWSTSSTASSRHCRGAPRRSSRSSPTPTSRPSRRATPTRSRRPGRPAADRWVTPPRRARSPTRFEAERAAQTEVGG